MKHKYNLFPTCVMSVENFISIEQSKDIVDYILSNNLQPKQHGAIKGNGVSYYEEKSDFLQIISDNVNSCRDLKSKLFDAVKDYENDTGVQLTELNNSWFNIQQKGSVLVDHAHPMSILSGALYVNIDADSSSLYFSNPNPFNAFQDVTRLTEYTYEKYWIKPSLGQLVIFPSWLKHGSNNTINESTNRIVISFNTK